MHTSSEVIYFLTGIVTGLVVSQVFYGILMFRLVRLIMKTIDLILSDYDDDDLPNTGNDDGSDYLDGGPFDQYIKTMEDKV